MRHFPPQKIDPGLRTWKSLKISRIIRNDVKHHQNMKTIWNRWFWISFNGKTDWKMKNSKISIVNLSFLNLYHSATGIGREGCEALFYSVKCDGKLRKPRLRLKCQEPKQNVRENSLGWPRLLNEKQAIVKPPHHNCKTNQPIHTHRTHVLDHHKSQKSLEKVPCQRTLMFRVPKNSENQEIK